MWNGEEWTRPLPPSERAECLVYRGVFLEAYTLAVHRRRGVVPTQGEDCDSPPLGWLESNEGVFQKLGRSSKASIYYLLTFSLPALARIRSKLMRAGRGDADLCRLSQVVTAA